jgi:hypothetical protein
MAAEEPEATVAVTAEGMQAPTMAATTVTITADTRAVTGNDLTHLYPRNIRALGRPPPCG